MERLLVLKGHFIYLTVSVSNTDSGVKLCGSVIIIIIIIYPLTVRVVGALQMIFNQFPTFSPVQHCPLGLGKLQAVHSLMLSSHLFLCLTCLLHPFIVPCKMVLARPDEWET